MPECFRSVLERLDKENELLHIRKPIDVRYISPLIVQAEKPVWFHDPIGFDIPVVSGLYWKRDRLARSLDWPESELGRSVSSRCSEDDGPGHGSRSTLPGSR